MVPGPRDRPTISPRDPRTARRMRVTARSALTRTSRGTAVTPRIGSYASDAALRAASSSSLRSRSAAAAFDSTWATERGTGDHHDVGAPDQPGQGHLGAGGVVGGGHLAQHLEDRCQAGAGSREEGRGARPHAPRAVVGVVATRQEALAERAVGDDDPVVGLGPGQQVALGAPVDQAEADLVGEHRAAQGRLGRLPAGQRVVADTPTWRTSPSSLELAAWPTWWRVSGTTGLGQCIW